jgi:preprotein translocase subunit SecD
MTMRSLALGLTLVASLGAIAGEHVLAFLLSPEGRGRMAEATTRHVGKRMAFFVESAPDSAPLLQTPILDGEFYVSGGQRSDEQLRALEGKLRGALGLF